MFPNMIVVPLDGPEFAATGLAFARAFVHQSGGRTLLMSTREDDDRRSARAYLDKVAAAQQGVEVSAVVVADRDCGARGGTGCCARRDPRTDGGQGHAHKGVLRSIYTAGAIDFAGSADVDLVALSSHARTGSARVGLGSVTMGVVGMARCPVLVDKTR